MLAALAVSAPRKACDYVVTGVNICHRSPYRDHDTGTFVTQDGGLFGSFA
jgi:hypothetical protein